MTVYLTPLEPVSESDGRQVARLTATSDRELSIAAARLGLNPGHRQTTGGTDFYLIDAATYRKARAQGAVHPPITSTAAPEGAAPTLLPDAPEEDAR